MPYLFDIKGVMKQLQTKKVRPSDASVCQINLPSHPDRKVVARFDGGRLSSDAGLLCLYALDQQHGLTAGFASCLKDARDSRYVRHQIRELLTQRSFQIVAGYEDCNDADSLRSDPIFKTVCDRLPESDPDLASQPTLSRLENSVDSKDLTRLGQWLLETYLKHRKKSRPEKIILDIDSTDDVTHGQQEFSFYHGYYREHMYHPLLLFDGETGLVCALLRPGNQGAAAHAVAVLKRVVARMRQVLGSDVPIEVRADSGRRRHCTSSVRRKNCSMWWALPATPGWRPPSSPWLSRCKQTMTTQEKSNASSPSSSIRPTVGTGSGAWWPRWK